MENKIIIGDSAEVLKTFPDKHFDLAILDPPYYKVVKAKWDHQWKTLEEYIKWLEGICIEVKRVLKDNGSLYVFGDDFYIAYVQIMLDKHFTFLNHLIWYKRNNMGIKGAHDARRYVCVSERVLFYAQGSDISQWDQTGLERIKLDINNFQPLRQYFKGFQEALGISLKQINTLLGHRKAEHAFYWGSTQWDLPTEETYNELCKLPLKTEFTRRDYEDLRKDYEDLRKDYEDLRKDYEDLRKDYEDLRKDYEDLRKDYGDLRKDYEDLRRPFNYNEGTYEVFDIPIIGGKERTEHPTTKPKELYKRLIGCATKPGASIIDPFAGSGTSLIAAAETGRQCVAIEKDITYAPVIEKRISNPDLSNIEGYNYKCTILSDGCETELKDITVKDFEDSLTDDEFESYFRLYSGVPSELQSNIKQAFWMGKGVSIKV